MPSGAFTRPIASCSMVPRDRNAAEDEAVRQGLSNAFHPRRTIEHEAIGRVKAPDGIARSLDQHGCLEAAPLATRYHVYHADESVECDPQELDRQSEEANQHPRLTD